MSAAIQFDGGGMPADRPRVLIVEDHRETRWALNALMRRLGYDPQVASNGREALELCRRYQPDLALLDMRMPEMDGLAATRAIKEECPRTAVIIVTMHENPDYLFEALKAGAAGYLLKDASQREVVTAIRQVLRHFRPPVALHHAGQAVHHHVEEAADAQAEQTQHRWREPQAQCFAGHGLRRPGRA